MKKNCLKPSIIFIFFIIVSSNCAGAADIDQIWSQMTEEEKREIILDYYQKQQMKSQSQQNQSNQPVLQCPSNNEELNKLQIENTRLHNKLRKNEIVFLPPAF